jgi:O-antigen/teichoic acid export membrane protein
MGGLRRVVTFADQGVSSVSNFVAVAIAANVASAHEFGQFSLAYAGLLLFLGAQRALIGETLLVRYSRTGQLTRDVAAASLGATALVAVPAVLLLLVGAATAGADAALWLVMAGVAPVVLLQDNIRYLFICEGAPGKALAIDGAWAVISIATMLLAVRAGAGVEAVLLWWGAGAAAALMIGLFLAGCVPAAPAGVRWLWLNRSFAFRYAGEFAALNASSFAVLYLLVFPLGAAGVGALRAAQLLFSPLNTVFGALKTAVIPELVRTRGTPVFRARLHEALTVVLVLGLGWSAAVLLLPAGAGEFVLGETWLNAADLRLPYAVQYLAMVPYTILLAYFRASEANQLSTLMRGVLAGLTLILPLALALTGSTEASAWGFAAAAAIAGACGAIAVKLNHRSRAAADETLDA